MRQKTAEIISSLDIPKQTVAVVASVNSPAVSLFLNGGSVSPIVEKRIESAVRDIAKLLERYGNVRIDLSDAPRVKALIEDTKQTEFYYSVLLQSQPTQFLVRLENNHPVTTQFFLSAARLHISVAEAVAEDLRDKFEHVAVLQNPYGLSDRTIIEGDVRESFQYKEIMGLDLQVQNS